MLFLIIFFYEIHFFIHRPDIEIQENFLLQRVQKKLLYRKLFIRTNIAVHLEDKILVGKCQSEDFGVRRSQKDLNSNFVLPEGFKTFCRSAHSSPHKTKTTPKTDVYGRRISKNRTRKNERNVSYINRPRLFFPNGPPRHLKASPPLRPPGVNNLTTSPPPRHMYFYRSPSPTHGLIRITPRHLPPHYRQRLPGRVSPLGHRFSPPNKIRQHNQGLSQHSLR